jgi:hypothetical protein
MMKLDRREFLKVTGAAAVASAAPARAGTLHALADVASAVPANASELCFMSARELADLIRTRKALGARAHGSLPKTDQPGKPQDQRHRCEAGR